MLHWHIEALPLELNYVWKIARNSSVSKINLFVRVTDQTFTGIGEAAPNIRYQETPQNLILQFGQLLAAGLDRVRSLEDLQELLAAQPPANALRFALESAYIHFICQKSGLTIPDYLGAPEPLPLATTFSLPIMAPESIAGFVHDNNLSRFRALKVKVNQESGLEIMQAVAAVYAGPLLIDGNEAWTEPESLLQFFEALRPYNIMFIEQPMPAAETDAYAYLKRRSPYALYADESVLDEPDFEALKKQFHGINMKLMKAGGYLNGKRILEEAAQAGLKTMIGCMVETSLGIWSALQLSRYAATADLDGFLIVKDEPFGIVKEEAGLLYLN